MLLHASSAHDNTAQAACEHIQVVSLVLMAKQHTLLTLVSVVSCSQSEHIGTIAAQSAQYWASLPEAPLPLAFLLVKKTGQAPASDAFKSVTF